MGRFTTEEAESFSKSSSSNSFFSLKNDKDVASVRLMYETIEDVNDSAHTVHEVELDGKKRYLECLRETLNSPVDDCPFCREKKQQVAKYFIPIYRITDEKTGEGECQIWERGTTYGSRLSGLCARYGKNTPLVAHTFDIERHGAKGSTDTTYEFYETGSDETELSDLPENNIVDRLILNKSADDMEYFLESGEFPPEDGEEETPFVRRSASRSESSTPTRRTPANRRRGEAY